MKPFFKLSAGQASSAVTGLKVQRGLHVESGLKGTMSFLPVF